MSDFDLEELVNLREMSRTLFEESSDALFLFDPETEQLLDANPMAQRLSGFTQHDGLLLIPIGEARGHGRPPGRL
jgi:PAS domain-containing protein